MPNIPDIEDQGFSMYNNLLHFYIRTNLVKAEAMAEEMLEVEFQSTSLKKLKFTMGNIQLFKKEYEKAMKSYQNVLKLIPDEKLKAYTLNK